MDEVVAVQVRQQLPRLDLEGAFAMEQVQVRQQPRPAHLLRSRNTGIRGVRI